MAGLGPRREPDEGGEGEEGGGAGSLGRPLPRGWGHLAPLRRPAPALLGPGCFPSFGRGGPVGAGTVTSWELSSMLHFTDGKTEAQRDSVICPRSCSRLVAELEFNLACPDPTLCAYTDHSLWSICHGSGAGRRGDGRDPFRLEGTLRPAQLCAGKEGQGRRDGLG